MFASVTCIYKSQTLRRALGLYYGVVANFAGHQWTRSYSAHGRSETLGGTDGGRYFAGIVIALSGGLPLSWLVEGELIEVSCLIILRSQFAAS